MSRLEFRVPDIGEGLSEVEIIEWLVAPGDHVRADQPVVSVQTDKANVEIPSPADGVIREIRGTAGDTLPVGDILLILETAEPALEPATTRSTSPAPLAASLDDSSARISARGAPPGRVSDTEVRATGIERAERRVLASPATRKLANDLGIDLASVAGTGPAGRVTREDVEAAARVAREPVPTPSVAPRAIPAGAGPRAGEVVPLRGIRRQVARAMTQAWQQVPHVTELREIDAAELVRAHRQLRARLEPAGVHLTFLPLFVKAAAAALKRHPSFNASLDMERETITYHPAINIGIATATEEGLVVPVIHDADTRSLLEIAREIERLATAARSQSLSPGDTGGGTFTVSNYGSYGAWLGTPIIRPPEVAIVGFGRIQEKVVPVEGAPAVRPILPIAVSADHRLNDGEHLAAFVSSIAALLADPVLLLAEE